MPTRTCLAGKAVHAGRPRQSAARRYPESVSLALHSPGAPRQCLSPSLRPRHADCVATRGKRAPEAPNQPLQELDPEGVRPSTVLRVSGRVSPPVSGSPGWSLITPTPENLTRPLSQPRGLHRVFCRPTRRQVPRRPRRALDREVGQFCRCPVSARGAVRSCGSNAIFASPYRPAHPFDGRPR